MHSSADIKELAVAAWRLEKWLDNLKSDRKMAAKSALRSIKKYIAGLAVEVVDPVGSKFDPGLAIEVVNNEAPETPEEELIIIETLSPYVYQKGELMQHARVIIGTSVKEAKKNSEILEAPPQPTPPAQPEEPVTPPAEPGTPEEPIAIGKADIERMMEYAKIL